MKLLILSGVRFHLRRPVQFCLALCGVALGVAVVAAMFIAIESAKRGFDHANEAVFGNVTHVLLGGPGGIDERLFTRLRLHWPMIAAAPVVQAQVSIGKAGDRRRLQLMGIDPFADARFRSHSPAPESALLPQFLSDPRGFVLSAKAAERERVSVDDSLLIHVAGRAVELRVLAVFDNLNELQSAALEQTLIVDIATAQEVLGMVGRLSRIDLNVPDSVYGPGPGPGPGPEPGSRVGYGDDGGRVESAVVRALSATLPADVQLQPGTASATVREQMTRAFYLNLRMLSVLALVVGLFIIYNAMSFSVVQRRTLFGTLRAIGVTGNEVLAVVLSEALLLAVVATALGLPLGIALADVLLALVTRSIEDLYLLSAVRDVRIDALALVPAIALGLIGSVLAALMPALEATAISARAAMSPSHLERRVRAAMPRLAGAGVCAALLTMLLLAGDQRGLGSAFAALFALVIGAVLLTPALTAGLVSGLQALLPARAGGIALMAVRGLRAGLSRSSVAIAALMVALATTVGVAVMVSSFRLSLQDWLQATLRADIYVGVSGRGVTATIPEGLPARIGALPQVLSVALARDVTVSTERGDIDLKAMSETPGAYRGLTITQAMAGAKGQGDEAVAWQALRRADAVLISESLSWRVRLGAGDVLRIHSASGARAMQVAAVFRDYTSDRGLMIMGLGAYRKVFNDSGVSGLGISLVKGADVAEVVAAIQRAVGGDMQIGVHLQTRIREASMAIFDRTFAITRVLQWLATLVACVGVLSALMALALERGREIAVLRAQGMTRAGVLILLQMQSVAMGLIAGLLSLPLGLLMALVLTHVINRRAFGWGMEFHLPLEVLGHTLLVAVVAAVLAGLYPAWRLSRTNPAQALRWT